jgi:cytochrome c biogenesis protein CcdA
MGMELPGLRTWIVFYLISFVVLLWAAFLSAQGVMLWVSLLLVIIIIGLNFMTVLNQIKLHAARKEFQHNLTKDFVRGDNLEVDDRVKH